MHLWKFKSLATAVRAISASYSVLALRHYEKGKLNCGKPVYTLRFQQANSGASGVDEKNFDLHPDVVELLKTFIKAHQAGSPTDERIYWIHLKPKELASCFTQEYNIVISKGMVKRQLAAMGFKYRKLRKDLATGQYAHRETQFKVIFTLIAVMSLQSPIISMDCKKKERLGNLYRQGKCYARQAIKVYDHDYEHLAEGKVIPHGIYDIGRNEAYLSIGKSHETAEFIADNLLWWWEAFGIHHYPDAQAILVLCDAGGANSYRHYAFKKQLAVLAAKTGIDFIVCHYPPYASKHNPIEHRVFPHLHRAMEGVILSDYNLVKELMQKTMTTTGLQVTVRINDKFYPTGIKTHRQEVDFYRIQPHPAMPTLSYRICA
jgi:Rhodopirellula transposase DDE domain